MKLTQIAVDNPVFATMMMVALLVLGLFSYRQLGVDQFPNVDFPIVVVRDNYRASPETVETEISRKIEESVNAIAGLKTLTSRALEASPVVIPLGFRALVPSAIATQDVREKVQQVRAAFPPGDQGAADPALQPRRPADRVVAVRSDIPQPCANSRQLADQIIIKSITDSARRRPRHHRRRRQAPDQHRARSRAHAGAARRRQRRHGGGARREPEFPRRQRGARGNSGSRRLCDQLLHASGSSTISPYFRDGAAPAWRK